MGKIQKLYRLTPYGTAGLSCLSLWQSKSRSAPSRGTSDICGNFSVVGSILQDIYSIRSQQLRHQAAQYLKTSGWSSLLRRLQLAEQCLYNTCAVAADDCLHKSRLSRYHMFITMSQQVSEVDNLAHYGDVFNSSPMLSNLLSTALCTIKSVA